MCSGALVARPNKCFNRSAKQRRRLIPVALRVPAPG
jgi:hypothetical protein